MTLAIMPAVADDYTLKIFGNANMDDTIDEEDIVYVKGIINGTNEETELADANYDDEIDEDDIDQIELIISGKEKELTILDSADRIVTLPKPVERVVVLSNVHVEQIRAMGAVDRIVGIDTDTAGVSGFGGPLFFPELMDIPVVGSYWDPNYEMIVDVDPDIVFTLSSWPPLPDEVQEKLASAGIKVVGLDFYQMETFYEELAALGYILDTNAAAEEYINFFQSWTDRIDEVVDDLEPDEKKTVYFEGGKKYMTYGGAGPGCGVPSVVRAAGGNYIYDDISTYFFEADPEDLVDRNPDVILKLVSIGDWGYTLTNTSEYEEIRDELLSRPELALVTAVKNDDVYVINWGVQGDARKIFGVVFLAKCLYPDKFEDLEPHDFIKEYLEDWQGIPYQGVYIYPYPPE
jgi:iron complex transport system substrate-binding protein